MTAVNAAVRTLARRFVRSRQIDFWMREVKPTWSLDALRARVVDVIAETHDVSTFVLAPNELWLGHRGRLNEVLPRDPGLMNAAGAAASFLPGGHIEGFADTFRALYRAVYQAVLEGRPAQDRYPTFADGHDGMVVCEAVERSAREGKRVNIERT